MLSHRQHWLRVALLVGVAYFLVGKLFALPPTHLQWWRLAAWIVSTVLFGTHILFEHLGRRNPPRSVGAHTAAAVAVGAFLLAIAGMIYSMEIGQPRLTLWLLALVLWPVFTAVPAFIAAFVASVLLAGLRPIQK